MSVQNTNVNELVGQVVLKLAHLPAEDLPLVIEFVDYLAQQRQGISPSNLSVDEIRVKARQRAKELSHAPRAKIVARFQELAEDIRQYE